MDLETGRVWHLTRSVYLVTQEGWCGIHSVHLVSQLDVHLVSQLDVHLVSQLDVPLLKQFEVVLAQMLRYFACQVLLCVPSTFVYPDWRNAFGSFYQQHLRLALHQHACRSPNPARRSFNPKQTLALRSICIMYIWAYHNDAPKIWFIHLPKAK
jgi:hypothetical protein